MNLYQRIKEKKLVEHLGIYREEISLLEGTSLIVSGTIGAGILSIPYVISKVGIIPGVFYILAVGGLVMLTHLLLGDVAVRTGEPMQIVGLAKKYLGNFWAAFVFIVSTILLFGALTVYIVGSGVALSTIFGGTSFFWSLVFFVVVAFFVALGMRTIKFVEMVLILGVLGLIIGMTFISAPYIRFNNFQHIDLTNIFLPYGVLLFAFHAITSVPEAYSIMMKKESLFKKAIIYAAIIITLVYIIFAISVVGVTGVNTTEIATIGLGKILGNKILVIANFFAILTMGSSFLMAGVSFRDSMKWDFKINGFLATLIVCGVPFLLFVFGLRSFIGIIGIVGGVFMSIELLVVLAIYKKVHYLKKPSKKFRAFYSSWIMSLLVFAFLIGALYSILQMFKF